MLKKIATILFPAIYLLVTAGNTLYVDYLMGKNEAKAFLDIENGRYDAAELIEVKIPLEHSYYYSSPGYERYNIFHQFGVYSDIYYLVDSGEQNGVSSVRGGPPDADVVKYFTIKF